MFEGVNALARVLLGRGAKRQAATAVAEESGQPCSAQAGPQRPRSPVRHSCPRSLRILSKAGQNAGGGEQFSAACFCAAAESRHFGNLLYNGSSGLDCRLPGRDNSFPTVPPCHIRYMVGAVLLGVGDSHILLWIRARLATSAFVPVALHTYNAVCIHRWAARLCIPALEHVITKGCIGRCLCHCPI